MRFWITTVVFGAIATALPAVDLTQAKFTQVINKVSVVSSANRTTTAAKLNDQFVMPDLVETGPDSLAELIAPDKTITRVGANTIFSFDGKGRNVKLEQGSLLFHSPKGKGGGTIKTKAASASVLGTTIVVTATAGGGFKAIVLEGRGQITLPNGSFRILQAGQVTFVLPGSQRFGPQLNINLSKLVESSRLVQGFEQELPSKLVIQAAVERQLVLIASGIAEDTRILIGNQATEDTVTVVDSTVIQQAVEAREDRLIIAKRTDLVINPTASAVGTADPGANSAHLFLDRIPFDLPILGSLNFSGVIGRNITIASTVTRLDFTPYLSQTDFTIGATETLDIQSTALQLYAPPPGVAAPPLQKITLAGRSGLTIAPNSSITVSQIGQLHLLTEGVLSLNNVSINNSSGDLHLKAGVDLVTTGFAQLQANTIQLNATRNATLNGPVARGFTTLNVTAANNLNVTSGSFTGASAATGIAANLSAGDTLTVNGTSVASVANISLSARTVNLSNIDFPSGSTVNLYSQVGQLAANPNSNRPSVPGHVNFILNVNYNGNPAQLFVGSTINIGVRPL